MTRTSNPSPRVDDWIELRGSHGRSARRGPITAVLDHDRQAPCRVRWDERHESIVYPADGVLVTPKAQILITG